VPWRRLWVVSVVFKLVSKADVALYSPSAARMGFKFRVMSRTAASDELDAKFLQQKPNDCHRAIIASRLRNTGEKA
jgi:hypothetical protein